MKLIRKDSVMIAFNYNHGISYYNVYYWYCFASVVSSTTRLQVQSRWIAAFWNGLGLVSCSGFNGPLRQYFSLYRAVSQREGERKEK